MKALKWIAAVVAALVLLLAAAGTWLVSRFDPNAYKAQIVEAVQTSKGRTLRLGGPITLKLWPRLHMAASDIQLSEKGRPQALFASAGELELAVELLPLLRRELVVDKVTAANVVVNYSRSKDGKSNIDDLLSPASPSASSGPALRFNVNDIALQNLTLNVNDAQAGQDVRVHLAQFKSGRIADKLRTPIELSGEIDGRAPRLALKLDAKGQLRLDVQAQQSSLDDAVLRVSGSGPQFTQLDLRLSGALAYDGAQQAISARKLALQGAGQVTLPASGGKPRVLALQALSVDAPSLDFSLKQRSLVSQALNLKAEGQLDGEPLKATLQASALNADLAKPAVQAQALKLSAALSAAGVRFDALNLSAPELQFDGPASRVSAKGLELAAKGARGNDRFDASVALPALAVSPDSARGEALRGRFTLEGSTPLQGKISSGAIGGSMQALKIDNIQLTGAGSQGASSAELDASADLLADLKTPRVQVPRLVLRLQAKDPAQPFKQLTLNAQGKADWDAAARRGSADLKGQLDDTHFSLAGNAALGKPITARVDATLDSIDLDRYLPPPAPAAAAKPDAGKDTAIDLSFVNDVVVSGSVRVGSLRWQGKSAKDIRIDAKSERGRLLLPVTSLKAYGGSIEGSAAIEAPKGGAQRITLKQNLAGIDVQQAMKDFAGKDLLEGRGNLSFDVNASGATLGQIKKSLDGSAKLLIRDGAVKGINLAKTLRDAKAALSLSSDQRVEANKTEKTDFSELTATLNIAKGVATNNDLSIKSPFLRIGGEGKVDIGNDSLDYVVKAALVGSTQGQGAADAGKLRDITVPVRLAGPFDALRYNILWSQVASSLVKGQLDAAKDNAKTRLQEQLRGKLGLPATAPAGPASTQQAAPQKTPQELLKEKAQERLKGLFGK